MAVEGRGDDVRRAEVVDESVLAEVGSDGVADDQHSQRRFGRKFGKRREAVGQEHGLHNFACPSSS